MKGVNKVILIGNVGKDPEIRYTQAGQAVATLSLATNERVKKGDGYEDRVTWHNLVFWGKSAEIVEQYVKKGGGLYVEGRLQTRKWQDAEGATRYTTEVVVRDLVLLGTPGGGGRAPHPADHPGGEGEHFPDPTDAGAGFDPNDDVPF